MDRPQLSIERIQVLAKSSNMFRKEKDPLADLDKRGDRSLFIFDIDSKFRRKCLRLTEEQEAVEKIFKRRNE